MPRIARCNKCKAEKEMPLVFQGQAMPKGWFMFRTGLHYGKVLCPKCFKEYEKCI